VRAQWLMLQQDKADDFVIATGEQHSVREFVSHAGNVLGMQIEWSGAGVDEIGTDAKTGKVIVRVDPRYFRPTEVETLLGDPSKAFAKLGWKPEISFQQLVKEMIEKDLDQARRAGVMAREGFKTYQHAE
jgi:GDPmannose 4,6-dehydratase